MELLYSEEPKQDPPRVTIQGVNMGNHTAIPNVNLCLSTHLPKLLTNSTVLQRKRGILQALAGNKADHLCISSSNLNSLSRTPNFQMHYEGNRSTGQPVAAAPSKRCSNRGLQRCLYIYVQD